MEGAEDRRGVEPAHDVARLRPLRRAGRRLGRQHHDDDGRAATAGAGRHPREHGRRRTRSGNDGRADGQRAAGARRPGRAHEERTRATPPSSRRGRRRSATGSPTRPPVSPRGSREVLGVDRLRRPSRAGAHQGRDARQHLRVLVHGHGGVLGSPVLGELQLEPPRRGARALGDLDLSRARSSGRRGAGPRSATRTCAGSRSSTTVATSPPSSSPSRSSSRCEGSFASSARRDQQGHPRAARCTCFCAQPRPACGRACAQIQWWVGQGRQRCGRRELRSGCVVCAR